MTTAFHADATVCSRATTTRDCELSHRYSTDRPEVVADRHLASLLAAYHEAASHLARMRQNAQDLRRGLANRPEPTGGWRSDELNKVEVLLPQAEVPVKAARDAHIAAEAQLYTGWSRFYLVTSSDGHIHRSTSCSTTYASTAFAWLTELSGLTEAEAVEAYGEILCSVCFPTAPVEWTSGVSKATLAERAARDADRAAKAAAKAAKGITAPDGSPLLDEGGRAYATERAASIDAVSTLVYLRGGWWSLNQPVRRGYQLLVPRVVEALAAKRGLTTDEILAELLAKADAKAKREGWEQTTDWKE